MTQRLLHCIYRKLRIANEKKKKKNCQRIVEIDVKIYETANMKFL